MNHPCRLRQGQSVLHHSAAGAGGHPGDNSRPPLPATATPTALTTPSTDTGPNRAVIASVAVLIAASTSPHPDPVDFGIDTSTPAVTAIATNQCRTASARAATTRNQPRTVAAGTPSSAAIGRCPPPAALARNAAQITSAA